MKKLIAILVVFALLTGAAFAQVTISGEAWAGATLVYGSGESEEGPFAAPGLWEEDEDGYWQHFGAKVNFGYETDGAEAGVTFAIKVDGAQYQYYDRDNDEPAFDQGTNPNAKFDDFGAWWWAAPGLVRLNMGQAGFDRGDATPFHYIEGSGNWFGISLVPVDMFTVNLSFIDEGRWGDRDYLAKGKFKDDPSKDKDGYGEGTLGDNFGNVFMLQAIAKVDGIGEIGFTYDNWYTLGGDDFATPLLSGFAEGMLEEGVKLKMADQLAALLETLTTAGALSPEEIEEAIADALSEAIAEAKKDDGGVGGLRGIFIDYSGEWYGVGVTLGFNYLMGVKEYGTDKVSAWGLGLGLSYSLAEMVGMDLTVGLTYDVASIMYDGDIIWDKNGAPVMNLGFSVGLVMPVDPFKVTFDASVDLLNLSGEKGFLYGPKKEKDMVVEWEINLGLIREIGGFTFFTGLDLTGDSGRDTKAPGYEGVKYTVPIKFSYAW